jgi:hypothetical protein
MPLATTLLDAWIDASRTTWCGGDGTTDFRAASARLKRTSPHCRSCETVSSEVPELTPRKSRSRSPGGESTYRDVQTLRFGSADLLGFSSRPRNESGDDRWL